jgi:hypothetical protein
MRRLFGRTVTLVTAALLGGSLMQAPAFTQHYAAALTQRIDELSRSVTERYSDARAEYDAQSMTEGELRSLLAEQEPANAEGLSRDRERLIGLLDARASLDVPAVLQPFAAGWAFMVNPTAREIMISTAPDYRLRVDISWGALTYAVGGVAVAVWVVTLLGRPFRPPPPREKRRIFHKS